MITMLSPTQWEDYELIDCGNFEKLERFGKYITIRPEPQAIWDPAMSAKELLPQLMLPKTSSKTTSMLLQHLQHLL
jgi:hypothetical protein